VARSRGFPQVRSNRRKVGWDLGPVNTGTNITTTSQALGTGGVQALLDGHTVTRIRGYCRLYVHVTSATMSGFHGALGMCIITENANGIGVTSVPHPLGDDDWDGWLWHHYIDVRSITATIADGANAKSVVQEIVVDSKAMRKFKESDLLVVVIDVVEEGTASMRWEFDSRVLLKLP